MSMKDLEKLDTFMVASMVARNIESINQLKEEIRKLKKRLMKTNQLLRTETQKSDHLKDQIKLLKKSKKSAKE